MDFFQTSYAAQVFCQHVVCEIIASLVRVNQELVDDGGLGLRPGISWDIYVVRRIASAVWGGGSLWQWTSAAVNRSGVGY